MCNALVSQHGLKNDECHMCSALSPYGFKNDALFHSDIFYVFRKLTSGESDRLLPGPTDSIGSDGVRSPKS